MRSKVQRAAEITPQVEGGRVRLPGYAPWLETFLDEVLVFPHGAHDDQLDAFVYLVQRLLRQGAPMAEWTRYRKPGEW
mgnify:CR=1 FL=1